MSSIKDGNPTLLELFAQNGCTEEHAIAMAMDMLFAGIDTSAPTVAWTLYELAKHPEVCPVFLFDLPMPGIELY